MGSKRKILDDCSFCQLLADLGLFDGAWDQLRRAEVQYGRGIIPEADMASVRKEIDACRVRLAEHFEDAKPVGVEEL